MEFLSSIHLFGLNWFELLGIYTLPGLSYASFQLLKEYRNRPSQFATDLLRAIGQKMSITERLQNIFVYTIAAICIAVGWPLFCIWAIYESKKEAAYEVESSKPNFNCTPDNLIAKVTPHDAEITSYVIDPLNTVPQLPFGHLNEAWNIFLADLLDEDIELWSFHIAKGEKCGKYGFAASSEIKGFAKVYNGQILSEFITESD
jgi:TM2 domain-containing membrane protein YozV